MKNLLGSINWNRDLGVCLNMLNSEMPKGRNEFYWEILKQVKGHCCVDIGFGTGFLSIIAVQHGATHVEAWEQDFNRYRLGLCIIDQLNLKNVISLHYGEFNKSQPIDPDTLIIHEIIGSNIWCEGMRSALPTGTNFIIPSIYSMKFEVIAINRDKFNDKFYPKREFVPKIPIDCGFKNLVQRLIDDSPEIINRRDYYTEPVIDCLEFYELNINNLNLVPDEISRTYKLTDYPKDDVLIFYPFARISHNDKVLPWSWSDPILLVEHSQQITITQNLTTGKFYIKENL